jgi:hypothetical protein
LIYLDNRHHCRCRQATTTTTVTTMVELTVFPYQRKRQQQHHHQRTNGSTNMKTFTSPVDLDLFNLSTVLSHHFNRRTSPLAHFFFRRIKFQFPPLDFWSRSTGKMVDSPPPAARSHRPGYLWNALDLARRAMPYSPLTNFFPPLPC